MTDDPKLMFDMVEARAVQQLCGEMHGADWVIQSACDEIERLRAIIEVRTNSWMGTADALIEAKELASDYRNEWLEALKRNKNIKAAAEAAEARAKELEATATACVAEVGEWGAKCGELRIERDSWRHAFDVLYGTLRRFANEGSSVNYQARKALNHPSVQAVLDVPAVERGGAFMSAENRALDAEARVKVLTEALEWYAAGTFRKDNGSRARAALAADKEGT